MAVNANAAITGSFQGFGTRQNSFVMSTPERNSIVYLLYFLGSSLAINLALSAGHM